jgi:DNA-binding MurR/RpiR family transcriptional regulator
MENSASNRSRLPSTPKNYASRTPANSGTALERNFDRAIEALSRSRRELIQKILDDSEDTYFLSSRGLAKRYNVDVGTIVRTIQALGYRRYADFVSDLRGHFVLRINPYTVVKAAASHGRRSVSDHIRGCVEVGVNNLNALRSGLDIKGVTELARRIDRARRILVIGVDLASTLAYYFSYMLVTYRGYDAEAPTGSAAQIAQKISLLGPKDLLIAISFGRCLQTTVDAAIHARRRGVSTFGITDGNRTPIARFCDATLMTSIASAELSVCYVAPLSAIEAVLAACAYLNPKRTLEVLKRKEEEEQQLRSRWYSPSGGMTRKGENSHRASRAE